MHNAFHVVSNLAITLASHCHEYLNMNVLIISLKKSIVLRQMTQSIEFRQGGEQLRSQRTTVRPHNNNKNGMSLYDFATIEQVIAS